MVLFSTWMCPTIPCLPVRAVDIMMDPIRAGYKHCEVRVKTPNRNRPSRASLPRLRNNLPIIKTVPIPARYSPIIPQRARKTKGPHKEGHSRMLHERTPGKNPGEMPQDEIPPRKCELLSDKGIKRGRQSTSYSEEVSKEIYIPSV